MKFSVTSSKVTGHPEPSGWVQAYDVLPEDDLRKNQKGHFFAIVSVSNPEESSKEGLDSIIVGREIISKLQEKYYEDLETKPFDALKNSVHATIESYSSTFQKIGIVACAVVNDIVYSAAVNDGEVVIYRDRMLATILSSHDNEPIVSSGFPKNGDMLLLGTNNVFNKISFGVVKSAVEEKTAAEAAEMFSSLVQEVSGSSVTGIIAIKFEEGGSVFTVPETQKSIVDTPKPGVGIFENTVALFKNSFLKASSILPRRKIYIRDDTPYEAVSKGRKTTLTVGVILLFLLVLSIIFGIRQKNSSALKDKYVGKLNDANHYLDEAIGLGGVDSERSRDLFIAGEKIYTEISTLGVKDQKIDDLGKKIEDARGKILGEYEVGLESFMDLTLLTANFSGDNLSFSKDTIYVLDKNSKKIVSVGVSNKKSKVVTSGDGLTEIKDLAAYEGRVFALSNDGIYEIDGGTKKAIDKDWDGEVLIHAYTGNLYVLDKEQNLIYRYQGYLGSFSSKNNWLSESIKPDFGSAREIAIDGAFYVLSSGKKIFKFSQGSPQSFNVSDASPEVVNIDSIYTNDENEFVYLLDRDNGRILVVDKSGGYVAQYRNEGIKDTTKIVASEKDKKIIFLSGGKLLSVEMKHL